MQRDEECTRDSSFPLVRALTGLHLFCHAVKLYCTFIHIKNTASARIYTHIMIAAKVTYKSLSLDEASVSSVTQRETAGVYVRDNTTHARALARANHIYITYLYVNLPLSRFASL